MVDKTPHTLGNKNPLKTVRSTRVLGIGNYCLTTSDNIRVADKQYDHHIIDVVI
jgi:hypothetical protein